VDLFHLRLSLVFSKNKFRHEERKMLGVTFSMGRIPHACTRLTIRKFSALFLFFYLFSFNAIILSSMSRSKIAALAVLWRNKCEPQTCDHFT